MNLLMETYPIHGYLILFLMTILGFLLFLTSVRTKEVARMKERGKELDKKAIELAEDYQTLKRALIKVGFSEEKIRELKDKYQPENDSEDDKRFWKSNGAGEVFNN